MNSYTYAVFGGALLGGAMGVSAHANAFTAFTDVGDDAAAIQETVDGFRDALGPFNAPEPVQNAGGRRQIDWDAAPDAVSAPNPFPGDFFNFGSFPRARGIEFTTPGSGFFLSATQESGVGIEFDNINNSYSGLFATFSPQRLFTPYQSVVTDAAFFSPVDQTTPAVTYGFGAVFSDVDYLGNARIEFFDTDGNLLTTVQAPAQLGNETLSFAGAVFEAPVVAGVRIYSGNTPIGPGVNEAAGSTIDLVVLDDFIYGEPLPVPEPASMVLVAGATFLGMRRRRA